VKLLLWFTQVVQHHRAQPVDCQPGNGSVQGVATKINREISPYCILLFGLWCTWPAITSGITSINRIARKSRCVCRCCSMRNTLI
jgi:hypothetical protein